MLPKVDCHRRRRQSCFCCCCRCRHCRCYNCHGCSCCSRCQLYCQHNCRLVVIVMLMLLLKWLLLLLPWFDVIDVDVGVMAVVAAVVVDISGVVVAVVVVHIIATLPIFCKIEKGGVRSIRQNFQIGILKLMPNSSSPVPQQSFFVGNLSNPCFHSSGLLQQFIATVINTYH